MNDQRTGDHDERAQEEPEAPTTSEEEAPTWQQEDDRLVPEQAEGEMPA